MKTIDIPGGTACLRDENEVRVRHKRLVETAAVAALPGMSKLPQDRETLEAMDVVEAGLTREESDAIYELQDAVIVAALVSWTLPLPLPTMNTVGDLEIPVYDALSAGTKQMAKKIIGRVNFEPSDPKSPDFQQTPTTPSADSDIGLRADGESNPTNESETSGTSTDTALSSTD